MIDTENARQYADALLEARKGSRADWDTAARRVSELTGLNVSALRREVDRVTAMPAAKTLRAGGDVSVLAASLYQAVL